MKKLFNNILNPGRWLLACFAVSIIPFLLYIVLNGEFTNSYAKIFYIFIYILLAFAFVVAFLIDHYNKTGLKKYVILTFGMLTIFIFFQIYSKDFLKRKSEERGVELAEFVEQYKIERGKYPNNLQDSFFDKAPKWSFFGSEFSIAEGHLEYYKDTVCYLNYKYYDYIGSCNTKTKKWHYFD